MAFDATALLVAAIWIFSLGLALVTLLPIIRRPYWWVRIWDYPRLQIAAGLLLGLAAQLWFLPPGFPTGFVFACTVAALGWQVFRILPYTRFYRTQVKRVRRAKRSAPREPRDTIVLLLANVLQSNRKADALRKIVRDANPDVALMLETDTWWETELEPLVAEYPHVVRRPLDNTYGMLLYSRFELKDTVVRELVTENIPSIFTRVKLPSGLLIDMHCLHPMPPNIGVDTAERDAELVLVAREVARDRRPTIVWGDMNDVAWSGTTRLFQRLSGMCDPRVGRGMYPTFHAHYFWARWPLDYVFHDRSFLLHRLAVLPAFGSDHFPILVGLAYDGATTVNEAPPPADEEDHEEADQIVAEGLKAANSASNPAIP